MTTWPKLVADARTLATDLAGRDGPPPPLLSPPSFDGGPRQPPPRDPPGMTAHVLAAYHRQKFQIPTHPDDFLPPDAA